MNPAQEKRLSLLLLLAVLVWNAAALWPELAASGMDKNDNVDHLSLMEGMVRAVEHGGNPLDFWSPDAPFGYPVIRTYQPLAHGLVALVYFALGKTVGLAMVFVWIRYLSVVLLPLSFFAAAWLLELPPLTAAAAALLAPLISTKYLYGLDYGSYVWLGYGLFPQAVASHFLLLTLGFAFRAIRRGRHLAVTGALLGLTFVSQFIYGYMGALTVCLLALIPDREVARSVRIRRTVWVGTAAILLAGFQLLPLLLDGSTINHSRLDGAWKYDSYGAGTVLNFLFTGGLLDQGRLPVLSLLALLGAALILWGYGRSRRIAPLETFVLSGAVLWILMLFGRPVWGGLLLLLGVSADMHLHRVIGGAHVFLVLLAAVGLAAIWRQVARRWHIAAAAAATALLLFPMVRERADYLAGSDAARRQYLAAIAAEHQSLDAVIANVKENGGNVYAGLPTNWGEVLRIADVPFYAFLGASRVPQISHLYHFTELPADILARFDELQPAQYRLFHVRSVVVPAGVKSGMPAFLSMRAEIGRFRILDAPAGGYFDLVDVAAAVRTNRDTFYDINNRWLHSALVEKKAHLMLDFFGDAPSGLPRLPPDGALPPVPSTPEVPGEIKSERRDGDVFQAEFEGARPSYVLLKMTWHPNWKVYIDGKLEKAVMLSPGFIGVPVTAGRHHIWCRYEPGQWKLTLAIAGLLLVMLLVAAEQRGYLPDRWAGNHARKPAFRPAGPAGKRVRRLKGR